MRNTWMPPIAQFFSSDYAEDMLTKKIGEPKMPPHRILKWRDNHGQETTKKRF